jgi:hypothetical protein
MISIEIDDFRGCKHAAIECAPIALLAGQNGAGKTSIAQGVGAALAGCAPIEGLGRGMTGMLVRTGAAVGRITVSGPDGTVRAAYPESRITTEGQPPQASTFAVGLDSIVRFSAKDRLGTLADYLHAEPTREELAAELVAKGLSAPQVIDTLWASIERDGWDGAERYRRERGAQLKGEWRGITGANYGSKVAASWRPDLADEDEALLAEAVARATRERDRAVSAAAVTESERHRLEDEAGDLARREDEAEGLAATVANATSVFERARDARQALPPAEQQRTHECPYCQGAIVIVRDVVEMRLEKASGDRIKDEALKARRMAIAEADGKLSNADANLNTARRNLAIVREAVERAQQAKERLANWPRAVESGTDLETATRALAAAEKRLAEFRQKQAADIAHQKVEGNEIAIGLLAPDGLRARKLAQVLDVFNTASLRPLCEAARWGAVEIDLGGFITYSGRPYALLSTSEQYRVRAVLAAAMAQIDGSALLVFDGADILDAPSRSGLFGLIEATKLPALICMTAARREHVPPLADMRLGQSYWIEAGEVAAIVRQAVAA